MYGNNFVISDQNINNLVISYGLLSNNSNLNLDTIITNKSLSSGQMQKVSFIRAMLANPEILILDESTSNLDLDSKEIIKSQLKDSKLTIINSSHNSEEMDYDQRLHIEVNKELRIIRISE